MSDLRDVTFAAFWAEKCSEVPVGSRLRAELVGELTKLLIDESVLLLEHHVPTDSEKRKSGFEVRRQQVGAAGRALAAFTEGWQHVRDAHGGRG